MRIESKTVFGALVGGLVMGLAVLVLSRSFLSDRDSGSDSGINEPTSVSADSQDVSVLPTEQSIPVEPPSSSADPGSEQQDAQVGNGQDFTPAQLLYLDQIGAGRSMMNEANRLVYRDRESVRYQAENGDIYAMEALGVYLLRKEPDVAYELFVDAAVHGSAVTLTHLALFHAEAAKKSLNVENQSSNGTVSDDYKREAITALAYTELASVNTRGYWGEIDKARLFEELNIEEEDIPEICNEVSRLVKMVNSRRMAEGIAFNRDDSTFSAVPTNPPFSCEGSQ